VVLTLAGALVFWGGRVFQVESFSIGSSALLGLAMVLAAIACFMKDAWKANHSLLVIMNFLGEQQR